MHNWLNSIESTISSHNHHHSPCFLEDLKVAWFPDLLCHYLSSSWRFVKAQQLILFPCYYKHIQLTVFPQCIRGKVGLSTYEGLLYVLQPGNRYIYIILYIIFIFAALFNFQVKRKNDVQLDIMWMLFKFVLSIEVLSQVCCT